MKLKIYFFLAITLVFVGSAMKKYFLSPPVPFSYDEPDYVANSMLLSEFNFGVDTDLIVWSQRWAYDQPHLYHFISGLFLESRYQQPIEAIVSENQLNIRSGYGNPQIVYGKTGDGRILSDLEIANYKKAYQVILVARELSFYFYLVGGIILISVIYFFCHPVLAALVSVFYLNDYFFNTSVLAQADGVLIFLILINVLLSLFYIKFAKYRLMIAILLGISCGLALSTKLNGGITMVSSMLSVITVFLYKRKSSNSVNLGHLPVIIGLTFAVFYWLNPYFYSNPVQNIYNMFQYRIDIGSNFKLMFPKETLPAEPINKIVAVFNNLYQKTGQTLIFSLLFSVLSSVSSLLLIFLIFMKKIIVSPTIKFLLVSSTYSFFLVLVYIPMDWGRYYYPAIIQTILMTVSVVAIAVTYKSSEMRKL